MPFLFSILLLLSALMVISAKNPVHSVLFLILAFLNATGILILWNVEFLAMLLLIVYVGAIAILFIFVVMMLNIKWVEFHENQMRYLPIGGVLAILFFLELYLLIEEPLFHLDNKASFFSYINWDINYFNPSSIKMLGYVIYTDYGPLFCLAGVILWLGMLGAIILTKSFVQPNVKKSQPFLLNKKGVIA